MTEEKKSLKRTLIGRVVSDKRAKTVTVQVERRARFRPAARCRGGLRVRAFARSTHRQSDKS